MHRRIQKALFECTYTDQSRSVTCILVYLRTELPAVVIDSYPPVTTVEQGESIVLVCRVVGVLPSVRLSYSWTCKGAPCEGTEVASGNRLRIGVINRDRHRGAFRCSITGSGVSLEEIFTLRIVNSELNRSAKYLEIPSWYFLYCVCMDVLSGAPKFYLRMHYCIVQMFVGIYS